MTVTKRQKIKLQFIEEIEKNIEDIRYRKEGFLRKYGWDNTSNFPDCIWRWVKSIKGETIAVSLDDAFSMESKIVEYKKEKE